MFRSYFAWKHIKLYLFPSKCGKNYSVTYVARARQLLSPRKELPYAVEQYTLPSGMFREERNSFKALRKATSCLVGVRCIGMAEAQPHRGMKSIGLTASPGTFRVCSFYKLKKNWKNICFSSSFSY